MQNVGYFSAVLAAIGIITLCVGVFFWQTKQRVADRKDTLEVKKLEKELEPMGAKEIINKTAKEVEEEAVSEMPPTSMPEVETAPVLAATGMATAINTYLRIEKLCAQRVADCFPHAKVLTNQKIGDTEYDIILRFEPGNIDYIFNVKYRKNKIDRKIVVKTVNEAVAALHVYQRNTGRKANTIILFIAHDSIVSSNELLELTQAQLSEDDRALLGVMSRFMRPEQVETLTCGQLKGMLTPGYAE